MVVCHSAKTRVDVLMSNIVGEKGIRKEGVKGWINSKKDTFFSSSFSKNEEKREPRWQG